MRLSPAKLSTIRSTLGVLDPPGRVYLFGSWADDQRRVIYTCIAHGLPKPEFEAMQGSMAVLHKDKLSQP